jgi:hypothetical protein
VSCTLVSLHFELYETLMIQMGIVDDGTEVIDCTYDLKVAPIVKDNVRDKKGKGKELTVIPRHIYRAPPAVEVGSTMSIIGKVVDWREGNQIHADTIGKPQWPYINHHRPKFNLQSLAPPTRNRSIA